MTFRGQHKATGGAALAALMLVAATAPVFAQSDPAAQAAERNQQSAAAQDAANQISGVEPVAAEASPRAELPPPGGPKVLVRSVQFEPASAFLSKAELDAISARYIGRKLDFSGISELVRDVNDLYAKKGVVTASAILPPQKLESGELRIELVEGRQGSVAIIGRHGSSSQQILKSVRLTRDGDVVDVPTAGEDIARFNATHHAQLGLQLQPGAAFGLTDLTLAVSEPPPNMLQFFLDNQGVHSTGEIEAGVSYQKYGLLGADDNVMFYATASLGSLAGTLNYDMPVSNVGTRVALGLTASSIHVIAGPTAPLNITGKSFAGTVTLSQALYARPDLSVLGLGTYSYGISQSFSGGVPLVDGTTHKLAAGVAINYQNDRFSISAQPQLVYALALDHLFGSERGIVLFAGNANAQLKLGDRVRLTEAAAWQATGAKLLPGNLLFQIGGPSTVRGYPSDGVAGDSGYYTQTELHWSPEGAPEGLDLYALADFGQVFSTFPAVVTMGSVGAGIGYGWENVRADLTVAAPVLKAVSGQSSVAVYGKLTGTLY